MSATSPVFRPRLPDDLVAALRQEAELDRRTLSAEIIHLLGEMLKQRRWKRAYDDWCDGHGAHS